MREPSALASARDRLAQGIERIRFLQFLFFRQWNALHRHAANRRVRIVGDIPIFVAGDSSDVWSHPELFLLDEHRRPTVVAGVPPDYFSATGQLWGNPLYDWAYHAETGYAWWIERLRSTFSVADVARVDHFRAFADYWAIPAGAPTAIKGEWRDGPGITFFEAVRARLGDLPIIAEDLGELSEKVPALLELVGFPGMRVLTFAFSTDETDSFLPHNYPAEAVAYTGTHDNDTTLGWWNSAAESERTFAQRYLELDPADPVTGFLEALWGSRAMFAIAPAQDLLGLDSSARMNIPGTTAGNWRWRMTEAQMNDERISRLLQTLNERYDRDSGSAISQR
jgi:4-alpha-glucanotransferase